MNGTEVAAGISSVTVHRESARVMRRGRLHLPAGAARVVVGGLPVSVDSESVRANVRGAGVTLVGVDVALVHEAEPAGDRLAETHEELRVLRERARELDDRDEVLAAELGLVAGVRASFAQSLGRSLAGRRATPEALAPVVDGLAERTAAVQAARREIARERAEIDDRVHWLDRQVAPVGVTGPFVASVASRRVSVDLEVAAAGEIEIEVISLVHGASWQPKYDLRLSGDRLAVSVLAEVSQHTGEDWVDVPLTLSTAQPSASVSLPDPQPWYVGVRPPVMARGYGQPPAGPPPPGMPLPAMAMPLAMAAPAAPALPEAAVVETTVTDSPTAVTLEVPRPVTLRADGQPHTVTAARLDLPAEVEHLCAPRLGPEVHVRAKVVNDSPLVLLPGRASAYHGDDFAGRTDVPTVPPGGELEVDLGVDDRVQAKRTLVSRSSGRRLVGSSATTRAAYRTEITNGTPRPVRLVLLDQMPVARDAEIRVRLEQARPAPTQTDDLGRMEWHLAVPANGTAVVEFGFSVEAPRDAPVYGLDL